MKILKRQEFLAMPAGTVYSEYEPCVFGKLCIKGDTWGNDFMVGDLTGAVDYSSSQNFLDCCRAMEKGASCPVDFSVNSRDGCFGEDSGMFAIYEPADIAQLIIALEATPGQIRHNMSEDSKEYRIAPDDIVSLTFMLKEWENKTVLSEKGRVRYNAMLKWLHRVEHALRCQQRT